MHEVAGLTGEVGGATLVAFAMSGVAVGVVLGVSAAVEGAASRYKARPRKQLPWALALRMWIGLGVALLVIAALSRWLLD